MLIEMPMLIGTGLLETPFWRDSKFRLYWQRKQTVPIDIESEVIFLEYNVGDIVRTKKQHPCGSKLWEITRVGVDFKLKCQGCGHVIMVERQKAAPKKIWLKLNNK